MDVACCMNVRYQQCDQKPDKIKSRFAKGLCHNICQLFWWSCRLGQKNRVCYVFSKKTTLNAVALRVVVANNGFDYNTNAMNSQR